MKKPLEKKSCWLFCNIIDNFGDIGVSWRLAQALYHELDWTVHLWVDDLPALRAICPDLPPLPCVHQNIDIHEWTAQSANDATALPPPQILIETFACRLPQNVLDIIQQHHPLWLNWEYLSAEESNERLHLMPSVQANGLQKFFWFMGFSEKSGGLLREADFDKRIKFDPMSFRRRCVLPPKTTTEWLLFGYCSPIWAKWLDMWQQYGEPITLLLAGNQIIDSLKAAQVIPETALQHAGGTFQTACVTLVKIPFVAQQDFDRLLQLSDGLMVRGEDSFVRAQLAAKLFFWHIYPQNEMAHLEKLHAFWQKTAPFYPPHVMVAHQSLSDELNGAHELSAEQRLNAWQTLMEHRQQWQQSVADWQDFLFSQSSAIEKLAKFVSNTLK
ncbi:elongation factor P maturation arginine rhamnosyltransferase EarP [Neisseria iguanae]|uniref:Protein-arginine rhamnosyltransferase n=1 Tax=Neisseria iguanae TaxID=90242 RepID=A0A2P7U397_9NEIS|nr:elongation factor P maturation arginine rhamnosyltransferase EarP [Neisseria iguanae]PSJ81449.1 elongation factor P maturation arginine rhamnosyltransferase EarP [Neisseria iguanae]